MSEATVLRANTLLRKRKRTSRMGQGQRVSLQAKSASPARPAISRPAAHGPLSSHMAPADSAPMPAAYSMAPFQSKGESGASRQSPLTVKAMRHHASTPTGTTPQKR